VVACPPPEEPPLDGVDGLGAGAAGGVADGAGATGARTTGAGADGVWTGAGVDGRDNTVGATS
jgi:hypothetical protein